MGLSSALGRKVERKERIGSFHLLMATVRDKQASSTREYILVPHASSPTPRFARSA